MPNVDASPSPSHDLWNRTIDASGAPPSPSTSASSVQTTPRSSVDVDVAYGSALDRLPAPAIPVATLAALVARMDPAGAKLDQLKAATSGPYTVNGATVYAAAQFRMSGGYNQAAVTDDSKASTLVAAAAKAGLSSQLGLLRVGRGSPEALVKLTQALIDGGQLPPGSTKPIADQIHDLQWRFGIGLDCAGYVYRAVVAVNGSSAKLGLKAPENENFTGLPQNSRFTKLSEPTTARPGDVIVLGGDGTLSDPGHNLVVRSHATLADSSTSMLSRWPAAVSFAKDRANIHVFEVDSSFGADSTGRVDGGVRRDVLLYDATSKQWCACKDITPPEVCIGGTPYLEKTLTGFFRAKVTP